MAANNSPYGKGGKGGHRRLSVAYSSTDASAHGDVLEQQQDDLNKAGIDKEWLNEFLSDIMGDDQQMSLFEFRDMWRRVFDASDRPMDASAWKSTADMFSYIDTDNSNSVNLYEIIDYLHNTAQDVRQAARRPDTKREWTWLLVGPDPRLEFIGEDDKSVFAAVGLWRILSQSMVLLSIVILMIDSLPEMQPEDPDEDDPGNSTTFAIEAICIGFFCIELFLYVYSYPGELEAVEVPDPTATTPRSKVKASWSATDRVAGALSFADDVPPGFVRTKWSLLVQEGDFWIDVLSIIPFWVTLGVGPGKSQLSGLLALRAARMLRALRALRALKLARSRTPELCVALRKSVMSLAFMMMLVLVAVCLSASFIYYAETSEEARFDQSIRGHGAWVRDKDSEYSDAGSEIPFQSIPHSMWWAIVTLTTVGYGDAFPTTISGRIAATITMLAGLIVVGYPITILTGTFQEMEAERQAEEARKEKCRDFYNGILAMQKACLAAAGDSALYYPPPAPDPPVVDTTFVFGAQQDKCGDDGIVAAAGGRSSVPTLGDEEDDDGDVDTATECVRARQDSFASGRAQPPAPPPTPALYAGMLGDSGASAPYPESGGSGDEAPGASAVHVFGSGATGGLPVRSVLKRAASERAAAAPSTAASRQTDEKLDRVISLLERVEDFERRLSALEFNSG
eukprot:TRINITY_DN10663_c0_g1_i1.p1 TRINITY_DN10663_c0_g1~~TRINITY_DN10663_c0_g1_i1.p1  ORF type:complete len:704 (+),score=212.70 TRINITY_DN10663_c0_g1_i1:72-2114(+)